MHEYLARSTGACTYVRTDGGGKDLAKVWAKVEVVDEVGGMGRRIGVVVARGQEQRGFRGGPGRVKGLEKGRLRQSAG